MSDIRCVCCGSVLDVVFSMDKKAFVGPRKYNHSSFRVACFDGKIYKVSSIERHEFGWLHKLVEA